MNKNTDTKNRKYSLSKYNPNWISKFNSIKKLLLKIFHDKALKIEHVGSTSIKGMAAKPLIDILVVVKKLELFEKEKKLMIKNGYEWHYYPNPEGLSFSKFNSSGEKLVSIHICEEDSFWVSQFIVIRDYLKDHPQKAGEYSKLKQEIIKLHPNDYLAYRNAKAPFLKKLKQDAYLWKRKNNKL